MVALIASTGATSPVGSVVTITTPPINTIGANALFVYTNVYGITTLTDSAGNAWNSTPPTPYNDGSGTLGTTGTLWYAASPIITSATHTFSAGGYYISMLVSAWSGIVTPVPYDTESVGAQGIGTTLATGPVTPNQDNSLIFAVTGDGWTGTPAVDSGFTMLTPSFPCIRSGGDTVVAAAGWAYLLQGHAATVNPTFTYSSVVGHAAQARAAVFKATSSIPSIVSTLTDAELLFSNTPSFVDLSNATTRRLFVSDRGTPAWVDSNGALAFGGDVPPVYLSVAGGVANTFADNNGAGGPFAIDSGPLTLAGSPGCTPYFITEAAGAAADPQWRLTVSDDGGRTWSTLVKIRSIGKLGEYLTRLRWQKMGQSRERMIKLECTDPVRRNIVGVYIDQTQGMG